MKKITTPLLILAVGFTFSLAANMLWTWDGGVVRVLGGALASCALPGAIHLWDKVHLGDGWLILLIRGAVMLAIALMAAYTTFEHASQLLMLHGEDPLLAKLYPVMTELLVVMGVLASRTPKKAGPSVSRRKEPPPVAGPSLPAPVAVPTPSIPVAKKTGETAKQWALRNWPVTAKEIELATGKVKSYSHRIVNEITKELAEKERVAQAKESVSQ